MFFSRFAQVIKLSFNSKSFYQDLYYNVRGLKLKYLVALLGSINLILVTFAYIFLNNLLGEPSRSNIVSQIPLLQVKQGQLTSEDKKPAMIFDRGYKLALIDIDAFPEKYSDQSVPFFINKTSIFVFNGAGGYSKALDFADFTQETELLNESYFTSVFSSMHSRLLFTSFVIMFPLMTLMQLALISVTLAVFSGAAWIYGKTSENNFQFKDLYRIAIFAAFPSLVIDTSIDIYSFLSTNSFFEYYFKIHAPLKRNIIFLISIGYFIFAVRAVLESKKQK